MNIVVPKELQIARLSAKNEVAISSTHKVKQSTEAMFETVSKSGIIDKSKISELSKLFDKTKFLSEDVVAAIKKQAEETPDEEHPTLSREEYTEELLEEAFLKLCPEPPQYEKRFSEIEDKEFITQKAVADLGNLIGKLMRGGGIK